MVASNLDLSVTGAFDQKVFDTREAIANPWESACGLDFPSPIEDSLRTLLFRNLIAD